jgi:hypothetical protein
MNKEAPPNEIPQLEWRCRPGRGKRLLGFLTGPFQPAIPKRLLVESFHFGAEGEDGVNGQAELGQPLILVRLSSMAAVFCEPIFLLLAMRQGRAPAAALTLGLLLSISMALRAVIQQPQPWDAVRGVRSRRRLLAPIVLVLSFSFSEDLNHSVRLSPYFYTSCLKLVSFIPKRVER